MSKSPCKNAANTPCKNACNAWREKKLKQEKFWKHMIDRYDAENKDISKDKKEVEDRFHEIKKKQFQSADCACKPVCPIFEPSGSCHCPPGGPGALSGDPAAAYDPFVEVDGFSINTVDIDYIKQIKEMSDKEMFLRCEIACLQKKEAEFLEPEKEIVIEDKGLTYDEAIEVNMELRQENKKLKRDLEELRKEYNNYQEVVGIPLQKKLEAEKSKVGKLEDRIKAVNTDSTARENAAKAEMDGINDEIQKLMEDMCLLNATNKGMQDENNVMTNRLNALKESTKCQKESQAATIKSLEDAIEENKKKLGLA